MKSNQNIFISLFIVLTMVCIFILIDHPRQVIASETNNSKSIINLQEKIAKGYSSKFCNSIGIGLSKEGATRLSIIENQKSRFNPSLWTELLSSGDNNLKQINEDELAEVISKRILYDCGNAIGLSGLKGIEDFKTYFITIRDEMASIQN